MKKLICILLISLVIFATVGCDNTSLNAHIEPDADRFEVLPYEEDLSISGFYANITYLRDTKTDIIYTFIIRGTGNGRMGGLCPLYNADGEPMTYEEFMEEMN